RPDDTQGKAFQLLGLHWAGSDKRKIQQVAKQLIALQRAGGSWGQRPELQSDAYATGQALWALREGSGMGGADPIYKRGVQYLLKTQKSDGSWHVRTRGFGFQPLRDTGFPHGRDQWISAAATGFAIIALAPLVDDGAAQVARH